MSGPEVGEGKPKMLLFFGWRRRRGQHLAEKGGWGSEVVAVVALCVVLVAIVALVYVRLIRPWHG